jgi:transcriptional regulator with XRE-family HTH domain
MQGIVNTLLPVTPEQGERLRAFLAERLGTSAHGWQAELSRRAGVHPTMLSRWFTGEKAPDLDSLERVAAAVNARRYEVVAALDGVGPVGPLDEAALRAEVEDLAERIVRRRLGR